MKPHPRSKEKDSSITLKAMKKFTVFLPRKEDKTSGSPSPAAVAIGANSPLKAKDRANDSVSSRSTSNNRNEPRKVRRVSLSGSLPRRTGQSGLSSGSGAELSGAGELPPIGRRQSVTASPSTLPPEKGKRLSLVRRPSGTALVLGGGGKRPGIVGGGASTPTKAVETADPRPKRTLSIEIPGRSNNRVPLTKKTDILPNAGGGLVKRKRRGLSISVAEDGSEGENATGADVPVTDRRRASKKDEKFSVTEDGTLQLSNYAIGAGGFVAKEGRKKQLQAFPSSDELDTKGQEQGTSAGESGGAGGSRGHRGSARFPFSPRGSEAFERLVEVCSRNMVELGSLGKGASGHVILCLHIPSLTILALKMISINEQAKRNQLVRELTQLDQTRSPYVISFYGAFFDNGSTKLALEFMNRGSLNDVVEKYGPLPVPVLASISFQVLRGLRHLHRRHQVHRDIKPHNLLVNHRGVVKLSDFGIAADLESSLQKCQTFVGTARYMSPERIQSDGYSYPADIWGFGMTIVTAALGKQPLRTDEGYWGLISQVNGTPIKLPDTFSEVFRDFIARCLEKDAKVRWTAEQLLKHPFLSDPLAHEEVIKQWPRAMRMYGVAEAEALAEATTTVAVETESQELNPMNGAHEVNGNDLVGTLRPDRSKRLSVGAGSLVGESAAAISSSASAAMAAVAAAADSASTGGVGSWSAGRKRASKSNKYQGKNDIRVNDDLVVRDFPNASQQSSGFGSARSGTRSGSSSGGSSGLVSPPVSARSPHPQHGSQPHHELRDVQDLTIDSSLYPIPSSPGRIQSSKVLDVIAQKTGAPSSASRHGGAGSASSPALPVLVEPMNLSAKVASAKKKKKKRKKGKEKDKKKSGGRSGLKLTREERQLLLPVLRVLIYRHHHPEMDVKWAELKADSRPLSRDSAMASGSSAAANQGARARSRDGALPPLGKSSITHDSVEDFSNSLSVRLGARIQIVLSRALAQLRSPKSAEREAKILANSSAGALDALLTDPDALLSGLDHLLSNSQGAVSGNPHDEPSVTLDRSSLLRTRLVSIADQFGLPLTSVVYLFKKLLKKSGPEVMTKRGVPRNLAETRVPS